MSDSQEIWETGVDYGRKWHLAISSFSTLCGKRPATWNRPDTDAGTCVVCLRKKELIEAINQVGEPG